MQMSHSIYTVYAIYRYTQFYIFINIPREIELKEKFLSSSEYRKERFTLAISCAKIPCRTVYIVNRQNYLPWDSSIS